MNIPILLSVVLLASLAETLLSLWLSRRQIAHVQAHRDRLPADFAQAVSLAEHHKAADYTVARERFAMRHAAWQWAVGAAWLLGGFDLLYGLLARITPMSLGRSTLFVLGYAAIGSLLSLPFSLYATFVVEQRFGFNRTSWALYARDRLKAAAVALLIATPLLLGWFSLMRRMHGLWWLYAWAALVVLMLASPAIFVRLIAPRFNRFTPLPEGELKAAMLSLLRSCGFRASALFTMDASRRTAHGNAYFVGFGRSKRIVLFDTLIGNSPLDEVRAIVAHELGHFRHGHVLGGLLRSAASLFVMLAGIGWLARQAGVRHRAPRPCAVPGRLSALLVGGRAAGGAARQLDLPAARVPGRRVCPPPHRCRPDGGRAGASQPRECQHADARSALCALSFLASADAGAGRPVATLGAGSGSAGGGCSGG